MPHYPRPAIAIAQYAIRSASIQSPDTPQHPTGRDPESLLRQDLEEQERTLGTEHPATLTSVHNLANLLAKRGDLAGAEPLYRRTLEEMARILGPEHPNTLASLFNLALLLRDQGKLTEAEEMLRRVAAGREKALLPGHPERIKQELALAQLRQMLADYSDE